MCSVASCSFAFFSLSSSFVHFQHLWLVALRLNKRRWTTRNGSSVVVSASSSSSSLPSLLRHFVHECHDVIWQKVSSYFAYYGFLSLDEEIAVLADVNSHLCILSISPTIEGAHTTAMTKKKDGKKNISLFEKLFSFCFVIISFMRIKMLSCIHRMPSTE